MCGIVGIVGWAGRPSDPGEVEAMTDAVAHRGPDGAGTFVRAPVALGHRRLAIIDPQGGRQPMSNDDGSVHITYNGELYNFAELRADLERAGHTFRTRSDTEVILRAYEAWGADCVARFRGMFAFGIADQRTRSLLLARDHFGIKPLYYRVGADYVAFASEIGALRRVHAPPSRGSLRAVDLFLKLQYIPQPHTIFADVHKLPPASTLRVGFDGEVGPVRTYWRPVFQPDEGRIGADAWEEEFRAVVRESVHAHTVADVPFGVFLSGGIDSTLVAIDLARVVRRPVHAFHVDFEGDPSSERRFAQEAAARAGVTLVSERVPEPSSDDLGALFARYGEPFGDSSSIPTYAVSRVARREVPMVLSGDGGDELFAGYTTYEWWHAHRPRLRQHAYALANRPSYALLRRFSSALVWRATGRRGPGGADEWQRIVWTIGDVQRHRLWRRPYRRIVFEPVASFDQAARHAGAVADDVSFAQQMDIATYLPGDILTKVDVASMAHGLEVRTPLVDRRVLELASRLPYGERFGIGPGGKTAPKALPKRVLARTMGDAFVYRAKQGFGAPQARWLLPGGPARALLDRFLVAPDRRLREWFDLGLVTSALDRHSPVSNMSGLLWLFVVLGSWLDQNREVTFE